MYLLPQGVRYPGRSGERISSRGARLSYTTDWQNRVGAAAVLLSSSPSPLCASPLCASPLFRLSLSLSLLAPDTMPKRIVCYGGSGALGRSVVDFFHAKGCLTFSVDVVENPAASASVSVNPTLAWEQQYDVIETSLAKWLGTETKLDAVFCTAGGWAGGSAADTTFLKNTISMLNVSTMTSVLCAHLATKFLSESGLLVLSGAAAAFGPTPGMIGYGLAKAAVHHLVRSLAQSGGGLPQHATVVAICPVTLDTPMNRKAMPDANFLSWTPCDVVASKFYAWLTKTESVPSGSLVRVLTKDGATTFDEHGE